MPETAGEKRDFRTPRARLPPRRRVHGAQRPAGAVGNEPAHGINASATGIKPARLDEAKRQTLPSVAAPAPWTPELLVGELHGLLMAAAKLHGKSRQMRIWANHGARPLPKRIESEVIVEPWAYFERMEADIKGKVARYSGSGKTPFIMGGGASSMHFSGTFGATRIWRQDAMRSPNCLGVNMCLSSPAPTKACFSIRSGLAGKAAKLGWKNGGADKENLEP